MNLAPFTTIANTITEGLTGGYVPTSDLEGDVASLSVRIVAVSAVLLILCTLIAVIFKNSKNLKAPLFFIMAFVMLGSTLFLGASTVYVNLKSDSGGPVHWHADFEIWACGVELELKDPFEFLSNKIGTPTLHEHDDKRIHLEGVVIDDSRDASLGKFFHVIGGAITPNTLIVPLNDTDQGNTLETDIHDNTVDASYQDLIEPYIHDAGENKRYARFDNGDTCGSQVSELQVFVYNFDESTKTYRQTKLDNPVNYSISPDPNVPPGDCIIFEFGPARNQTDRLCAQYGVRDIERCGDFGVEADKRAVCEIRQVDYQQSETIPHIQTEFEQMIEEEIDDGIREDEL